MFRPRAPYAYKPFAMVTFPSEISLTAAIRRRMLHAQQPARCGILDMAYIRRHKEKWRAQVEKHGARESRVFDTKREAQQWAIRKESELDAIKGSRGKTFGAAVVHYQKTVSSEKRSPLWEGRRLTALEAHFGEGTPLAKITSAEISGWKDKRLETVSGSTVVREANLLRNLFTKARNEWGWIAHDPFKGVELPAENSSRESVWRWQQIRRVLRYGETAGTKTQEVITAFHIALRTAMRLNEALRAPAGFDPVRRVVTLNGDKNTRPLEEGGKLVHIPVTKAAARLLKRCKPFTVDPNEASALFCNVTDNLLIEGLEFRDSRATALTLMARKMDVMTLARISRHRDLKILLNTYYRESAEQIAARI